MNALRFGNQYFSERSVGRRQFLKYCASVASLYALTGDKAAALSKALSQSPRQSVVWLSFQECTGCTESLTRSFYPKFESLIFDLISLDYHHTLQAASGQNAESALEVAMQQHKGQYLLVVDGSIPTLSGGACSTIAGQSNLVSLENCARDAAAIIAVGTCASFGGLPAAAPNPTGAKSVTELMLSGQVMKKPLMNLPGCPPLPFAISGALAFYSAFQGFPQLDEKRRPLSVYGNTVHERCTRYHFYSQGKFAKSFDDEGARKGWCLYHLGCRGPVTHNACSMSKWNGGTSSPIEAGHPCIGCSEPGFWDRDAFYTDLENIVFAPLQQKDIDNTNLGEQIYQEQCTFCHSTDPARLKTPPEKVDMVFENGNIRSHRKFTFSKSELEALERYLIEEVRQ